MIARDGCKGSRMEFGRRGGEQDEEKKLKLRQRCIWRLSLLMRVYPDRAGANLMLILCGDGGRLRWCDT